MNKKMCLPICLVKFNEPSVLNPILKIVKNGILFSYGICLYLIIFTPSGRVTDCSIMWTMGQEFIELLQAEQEVLKVHKG